MKNRNLLGLLVSVEIITVVVLGILLPHVLVPDKRLFFQVFDTVLLLACFYFIRMAIIKKIMVDAMNTFDVKSREQYTASTLIVHLRDIFETARRKISNYEKVNQTLRLAIDVNNALLGTNDNTEMYEIVLSKAMEAIVKCDKGSVMILNKEDDLEFVALHGFDESFYELKIPKKDAFLYKLTNGAMNRSVIVPSVVEFNRAHMSEEDFYRFYEKYPMDYQTTITAPIRYDDTFLGVINLDSNDFEGFSDEDVAIMDLFASQLEVSIKNQNLVRNNLYLSRYDSLTGAYNRSYFDEIISERLTKDERLSFIVIDLNDLKQINDKFGHLEGDNYLKVFSEAVRKSTRMTDIFGRIGGDEFIVALNNFSKREASKVIVRILEHIREMVDEDDLPYEVTFSYGITDFPTEATTYESLYNSADKKMYEMKRSYKESR